MKCPNCRTFKTSQPLLTPLHNHESNNICFVDFQYSTGNWDVLEGPPYQARHTPEEVGAVAMWAGTAVQEEKCRYSAGFVGHRIRGVSSMPVKLQIQVNAGGSWTTGAPVPVTGVFYDAIVYADKIYCPKPSKTRSAI